MSPVVRKTGQRVPASVGKAIRANRLRAGMTQIQLGAVISRTGKFISEVETGRARLNEPELNRLAVALGVTVDKILLADPVELEQQVEELPRRIRESQQAGLIVYTFQQLLDFLDRAGWLRNATLWNLSAEPFPEERDVALVEQLGDLVSTKDVQLCYVFPLRRQRSADANGQPIRQGTREALPSSLLNGLRFSERWREQLERRPDVVRGYALDDRFAYFSPLEAHMWVETVNASWSEVMPLLYGRPEGRTHENSNASVPFWYHLPRDRGSRMLIELAQSIKASERKEMSS